MADRPIAARLGLVGIPMSGKTSLFCALTGAEYAKIVASSGGKSISAPVRVLDPLRAEWYGTQGLETICPTRVAIEQFEKALTSA